MKDLKVTIIQADIIWEDINANLVAFENKIRNSENSDLVVLPEMFTTGFSMNTVKLAENVNGLTLSWMRNIAEETGSVICGSVILKDELKNENYNSFIWMRPDGSFERYDKRHLFRMSDENENFTAGTERKVFELDGWKICPQVCYDLRFPVWSRNRNDYDILIYVANWPAPRRYPWETLLKARAIENQAYVVAANRVGEDEMGNSYSGDSMIIDPKGNVITNIKPDEVATETGCISHDELIKFREKFPAYLDGDDFSFDLEKS